MAHFYIKVPPHIAQELGLTDKPTLKLKDGNYMAYITHFQRYCPLYEIKAKAPTMGCLVLTPGQMKEEIDGVVLRPLPEPTDPRFFPPQPQEPPSEQEQEPDNVETQEGSLEEEEIQEEPQTEEVTVVTEEEPEEGKAEEEDPTEEEEGGE